jgi:hypothetical protein
MSEPLTLGTVTITRTLTGDDMAVEVSAETSDGDTLDLVESLGMLELAKMALLEDHDRDDA